MKRKPFKRMDYTDWTVEQHADYLMSYPPYQDYFANYSKIAVEFFIRKYAEEKKEMFVHKAQHKADYETHRTLFMQFADGYIDLILQKKLFNLQCQWRAGLIVLPHVFSSHDFRFWQDNIRTCPIIPPITEAEINLCIRFLTEKIDYQTEDWDNYEDNWQEYENFQATLEFYDDDEGNQYEAIDDNQNTIVDEDDDDDDLDDEYQYPEFYKFFDKYQGTRYLLSLRDVRGDKEDLYLNEARRLNREKAEADAKANGTWQEPDLALRQELTDHVLNPYLLNTAEFVKAVEDNETKEAYSYQVYWENIFSQEWQTEDYVEFLTQFNEPIEIKNNKDWRIAVELTARRFRQNKIAEMMPYAYATYALEFDETQAPETIVAERVARYVTDSTGESYSLLMVARGMLLDGRASLDGIRDLNIF